MFRKILIANRGEIACRVAATARRLGVRSVAVYSDADAGARHVRACDEACHIGGAAPRDSYLRGERIIQAALASGAQAVHPGYGFLSENEDFAQACTAAGLVFIGPPAAAIAAMGSKSAAKALMERAGVPLVPGYHGDDNEPQFLQGEAERLGFPVLIKASAGGGGKGMRRVDRAADFQAALAACRREAQASFGDDRVLVERYVTRPRHIEIQVFGDTHGQYVYLFERDCSVQRRHQKVLEEAPAPGLRPATRAAMGAAAVAAARAVGYVGAGTVEFIAEPVSDGGGPAGSEGDLRFYFMEMNTRLQVEHPVTEAITGHDLVEWQLRVAAGQPLPATQAQLSMRGHAIEARICAENPEADFLPATGRLHVMRWPAHAAFARDEQLPRVDTGFGPGDMIAPHYDSMVAKLIVWGADRDQALARLDAALAGTHIVGLHNNVEFLRRVVNTPAFRQADLDTALIERERALLFGRPPLPLPWAASGVVAHTVHAELAAETSDPWSRRDGWRLHGSAVRRFEIEITGQRHPVMLERRHDGGRFLSVAGERRAWTAQPLPREAAPAAAAAGDGGYDITWGEQRLRLHVYARGEQVVVFAPEGTAWVTEVDVLAHAGEGAAEAGRLTAPMPGKVVAWLVKPGDAVRRGQALAVMEAMKMEHTVTAPADGTVGELRYAVGDQVAEGQALLELAGAAQPS